MSKEKENQTLTTKLAESQDAVCQLKQLVENHVASEREKNKRVSNDSKLVLSYCQAKILHLSFHLPVFLCFSAPIR